VELPGGHLPSVTEPQLTTTAIHNMIAEVDPVQNANPSCSSGTHSVIGSQIGAIVNDRLE
jgi:hypothetical protein